MLSPRTHTSVQLWNHEIDKKYESEEIFFLVSQFHAPMTKSCSKLCNWSISHLLSEGQPNLMSEMLKSLGELLHRSELLELKINKNILGLITTIEDCYMSRFLLNNLRIKFLENVALYYSIVSSIYDKMIQQLSV